MSFRCIDEVCLADTARVTGEVELHTGVSVWYGAAIRGDVAKITIGTGTNVQDNATVHCDSGKPNVIGADVTIGHNALVHGLAVGDGSLIGMHATVLGGVKIGEGCLIAAGAVVPPGLEVPDGHVVMGVPGRVVRETNAKEKEYLAWLPAHYRELAMAYVEEPEGVRFRAWSGNG
ncbi:MAG: gamma carbonic anhydrase family protein [Planctomycetota bacterium]